MSSKVESTKSDDEDISCGLLLRDIEEISRALYLHKSPHDAFNSTRRSMASISGISEYDATVRDSLHKGKKSSIWNWKPIKSLTHTRNHRFNCCFSLHVHAIEGLPSYFNNLSLCVVWKQKAVTLRTRPTQVCLGMAEFEETLMHRCTIFVDRTGIHSSVKYEPQLCLLHASVIGSPTLDIGSQVIDLTRFLPLTLEELVGGKSSSGKWTTSFKLSGKAKGAVLNVSFGFSIYGGSVELDHFAKVPDIANKGRMNQFAESDTSRTNQLHKLGTVSKMLLGGSYQPTKSANLNLFDELLLKQPVELSQSVALLYQKLDKKNMGYPLEFDLYHLSHESGTVGGQAGHEFDNADFDVIEQGIEVLEKDQITPEKCSSERFESSVIETIDVDDIFGGEETDFVEYVEWNSKLDADNHGADTNIACITEPAFEEVDSDLDSLLNRITYNEPGNYMRSESIDRSQRLRRSLSLDDLGLAESIENDFLNMLSIDQDQENTIPGSDHGTSTDLLRLFEEDPLAWEDSILDSDLIAENDESCSFTPTGNDKVALVAAPAIDLSFPIQAGESSHHNLNQSIRNKRNAEMLETLETEALMHEWGLSEKAFQYSPRVIPGGFGSPVYLPTEEPLQLPPIVEGKGPIVRTKNGGFLRSMNPLLFRNANNGARLIVQVSAPVVFPSAMGSLATEVLRSWACAGFEKMCFQANELMPLEDVTGKTIQQVLAEAESGSDASNRWDVQQESDCSNMDQIGSDYVPIEDLVPMVITNIESLLVEGLKIQSGMPDQAPPSSIRIHLAENSTSSRNAAETSSNFGSERASGFPILDADELIKCSLSLEEWLRLDSGKLHVEDDNNENISKLSAAHCDKPVKLSSEWLRRDYGKMKLSDRSGVEFGDNFRMGLKVQLRDPMRDYEMVGAPMLALAQVNRVYKRMTVEGDDLEPMFKVSEAHLAGFNIALLGNKPFWGTSRQRQSGSRWLLSSGMARSKKNLVSNSNVVVRSSFGLMKKAQNEDVLWSISLPLEGEAAAWDERIALNVHVRNADIVFPIESV